MFELKTIERSRWNELLEELALNEYVEEFDFAMSQYRDDGSRPGAPVHVCPHRFFDTTTTRHEHNVFSQRQGGYEIDFALPYLNFLSYLLEQHVIDEDVAVALFKEEVDLSAPADGVFRFPEDVYVHNDDVVSRPTHNGLTVSEAIELLKSGELMKLEDGSFLSWGIEADDYYESFYELIDQLDTVMEKHRIHRILMHLSGENGYYTHTELFESTDLPDTFARILHTEEDEFRSFYPGNDAYDENPLDVIRLNAYRGGGFSCIN